MPVGPLESLFQRLLDLSGGAGVLLGVDLPIGLPGAYAHRSGIDDFRRVLPAFGTGRWRTFYDVATVAAEIRLERPFYPRHPHGARLTDLVEGLGLDGPAGLRRLCDWQTGHRRSAARLFWTLGAQQVGKGAIIGWRDLLGPALRRGEPIALWPFDGPLGALLEARRLVVAEAYPAELYHRLGIGRGRWSKRRPADRAALAPALLEAAARLGASLAPSLAQMIRTGFGGAAEGEDRFDALAGLLGLLDVLRTGAPEPEAAIVRSVEGWNLGLDPADLLPAPAPRS